MWEVEARGERRRAEGSWERTLREDRGEGGAEGRGGGKGNKDEEEKKREKKRNNKGVATRKDKSRDEHLEVSVLDLDNNKKDPASNDPISNDPIPNDPIPNDDGKGDQNGGEKGRAKKDIDEEGDDKSAPLRNQGGEDPVPAIISPQGLTPSSGPPPPSPPQLLPSSLPSPPPRKSVALSEFEGIDDDCCPVCLEENLELRIRNCRHCLCIACARGLMKRHLLSPAQCPYCRELIGGFEMGPKE